MGDLSPSGCFILMGQNVKLSCRGEQGSTCGLAIGTCFPE